MLIDFQNSCIFQYFIFFYTYAFEYTLHKYINEIILSEHNLRGVPKCFQIPLMVPKTFPARDI